jgi:hypothetical protein
MVLFIISIIFLILSCILLIYTYKCKNKINVLNTNIANENYILDLQNQSLKEKEQEIEKSIKIKIQELNDISHSIENDFENKKALSNKAFESYCDTLNNSYKEKEREYQEHLSLLGVSYEKHQLDLLRKTDKIREELDSIKATRTAAIQAQIKEKEIKEKREFYMLCPKTADIDDIRKLERIKPDLHNPRILSMLIWSTFFQKPMTTLCNNVLGTSTVTGIYKITNQENDMCYIGQAVDVATRWKNHAKCGLDIDTPAGNKLYKAMKEEGIWNFSWELLEECPRNELDAKEKFYIELYQSKDFGYNTTKGNTN